MALPLVIPIASTLIGSGLSVGQAVGASKRSKEAMAAADAAAAELRAKRYEDTMAGLQIPMMGFEQAAQKQAQREAMQIQALQEAGGAAVLGGTPGLAAMGAEEDLARMAQIDQMEYARNLELARNQQAISDANLALQANLIGMELAGAQQASAQEEAAKRQAITNAAATLVQGGIDIYGASPLYKTQKGLPPTGTRTITDPVTGLQSSVAPNYVPAGATTPLPPNMYGLQANPNAPGVKQALTSVGLGSPSSVGLSFPGPISYTGGSMPGTDLGLLSQLPPSMGGTNINAQSYFPSITPTSISQSAGQVQVPTTVAAQVAAPAQQASTPTIAAQAQAAQPLSTASKPIDMFGLPQSSFPTVNAAAAPSYEYTPGVNFEKTQAQQWATVPFDTSRINVAPSIFDQYATGPASAGVAESKRQAYGMYDYLYGSACASGLCGQYDIYPIPYTLRK